MEGDSEGTFLARANALDADEEFDVVYIVAAVCEALECHQARQCFRVLAVERSLELRTIIAVHVYHEVAIPLAFREDARE